MEDEDSIEADNTEEEAAEEINDFPCVLSLFKLEG